MGNPTSAIRDLLGQFPNSFGYEGSIRGFQECHTACSTRTPCSVYRAAPSAAPSAAPLAFRATPIEDRGFRPSHDPSGKPFGATPIEDGGFGPSHDPSGKPSGKQFGATPIEDISYQPSISH